MLEVDTSKHKYAEQHLGLDLISDSPKNPEGSITTEINVDAHRAESRVNKDIYETKSSLPTHGQGWGCEGRSPLALGQQP